MKLINIFEELKPTPEELFKRLVLDRIDIENPVSNNQSYPWRVFWFDSNGKHICEWDYKNEWFFFNYELIWSIFEDELNLKHYEIQEIMRDMMEKHFGLRGVTPMVVVRSYSEEVEKHFKKK